MAAIRSVVKVVETVINHRAVTNTTVETAAESEALTIACIRAIVGTEVAINFGYQEHRLRAFAS